eukprot:CAMPEP_0184543764 /NCGR_PEP_ID=MMETSP0199_2-20130426/3162_1 /TAXON_ID=1112570 /ORGANISM="Thraustochytrium sp., Strain LLF1b" /LENGTH=66 /DNA_ID=CAMNT_0026937835 /DNA_START=52 /DNA_END=252 /DNA_ORIENTATION=-
MADDGVDVDAKLELRGCSDAFEAVQLCLADNDRDWVKCQEQVKTWKACMASESSSSSPTVTNDKKT